jgi:hypothetical protein
MWRVEDYLKLRRDVQMYCGSPATNHFEESTFSPEWYKHNERGNPLLWYGTSAKNIYYIRVDTSKPEYEPV